MIDVAPVQSVPVESCLFGKHRELYYAHKEALKLQSRDCLGLGIELALKVGHVAECRDRLQSRLLSESVSPSGSIRRRSSSRVSVRPTCGDSSLATPNASAIRPHSAHSAIGPVDSSSSSGLSIPDLVTFAEDGGLALRMTFPLLLFRLRFNLLRRMRELIWNR